MTATASAISLFHPTADATGFDDWVASLLSSAQSTEGFVGLRVSIHDDARFDWGVEVSFRTEELLHAWLDSPARAAVLGEGASRGFRLRTADLVFVGGSVPPTGVGVFLHTVAKGKEADFVAAQARIAGETTAFSGCEGTALFPPDFSGEWMSVVRFRMGHHLAAWMKSGERAAVLPEMRASLTKNFSEVSVSTPFGSTVRTDDGKTTVTPDWKIFLLVLVMLYPLGMLEKRFLDPAQQHFGVTPWMQFFVGLALSVAALQWLLMPAAAVIMRRWLDPVDGKGLRTSLTGALILLVIGLAMLALFASVKMLQFWDFAS